MKVQNQMASLAKSRIEDLIVILLKLFQKIEEGVLPNLSYKGSVTLTPTPSKDNRERRILQVSISDEHRCKNPKENTSELNTAIP